MKLIIETLHNIKKHPFKSAVTFLSVGVGVGILIFALSLSIRFSQLLDEKVNTGGVVLTVSNSELQADGTYERARPGQLDTNTADIIQSGVSGIDSAAILSPGMFNELAANGEKYSIRTAIGTDENYVDVMDLELIAGVPMTDADTEKGNKKIWLSESTAIAMFGTVNDALGKNVQPPANNFGPRSIRENNTITIYQVAGVFADADELRREAYGIADVIVPYTAGIPSGANVQQMLRFFSSTFVVKVIDNPNADAQIYDVLAQEYGLDLQLNVWEGTMQGPSTVLEETRDSINQLSFIINLLGFILLVSGAIGILSIMMVEIIGKNRDIALERALGASKPDIVKKFLMQAFMLSGLSGVVGIVLAYGFASPMVDIVMSVFDGIELTDMNAGLIHPVAIVAGLISALLFGGLFGVLPLSSLLKQPIAEGLRDA